MKIIDDLDVERLVRSVFPEKRAFSAAADLGVTASRPAVAFVHGGPDPFLDRQFDAWLDGSPTFVSAYQVLNRLCRAGVLPPGDYAVRRRGAVPAWRGAAHRGGAPVGGCGAVPGRARRRRRPCCSWPRTGFRSARSPRGDSHKLLETTGCRRAWRGPPSRPDTRADRARREAR